MTVLLVLAFFAFFIALDYAVARRRAAEKDALRAPAPDLEPAWVAGFQMPEGLYYPRGHTWVRPIDDSTVLVGVDDFARRLVGSGATARVPARGDWLHQGERAFALEAGGRVAGLVSPIEGEVTAVNPALGTRSGLVSDDPYGRGWVMQVKSPNLAANLRNLLSGRLARKWMEDSREALELRLMALAGSVLQDGGEPAADLGAALPKADWERLAREFLLV